MTTYQIDASHMALSILSFLSKNESQIVRQCTLDHLTFLH